MPEESLKNRTVKGLIWSGLERFSVQGVQFLVLLIIARILNPKDFGLVGMLTIFIAVAQSLIDSGFSQALIRKQKRKEIDNSTVFFFNIIISVLLYFLFYLTAPWVADFYNESELRDVMRVLCLIIIINSFAVVQRALYTSALDFKTQTKASFIAAGLSGVVGILLASYGYGVWSLVFQQLTNASINTLLLWLYSNWYPKLIYSWNSFRELFSFGSKLMVSGLIDTIYNNIYQLVIGKFFSASSLGYYTQANNLSMFPSSNITNILQRVTYPVLCTLQNDDVRLREDYRKLIMMSAFIVFPLMCGLAGLAYPLVEILLGEKWLFCATLIIPLCFNLMWYPVAAINLNLLQVKGRSDLFLRLEIIKKIIGVITLFISLPFGLVEMCYARIISGFIGIVLNTYYTGVLIDYGFINQMKDLYKTFLTSLLLFIVVFGSTLFFNQVWTRLVLGLLFGILLYSVSLICFRFKEMGFLLSILKR